MENDLLYDTAIPNAIRSLLNWLNPPVAADIRNRLQHAQFDSVQKQVPMLLSVAALNTIIIMAVCVHDGLPLITYGWMALLVIYCVVRIFIWRQRLSKPLETIDIPKLLRWNIGTSLAMITGLGIATAWTFLLGTFGSQLLIPMSLGFGSLSIAHCLYTLRPAAVGTVVMGIVPSSLVMIIFGGFEAIMLGIAMLSVAVLMIRFVAEQYDQLLDSLNLELTNWRLANTDALTGIANRRAIMTELEFLEGRAGKGQIFAIALLDLDGFKQINDKLGHHVGDEILRYVATCLVRSVSSLDMVGRLGGDEFIILLSGINNPSDMEARTALLLANLCQQTIIEGHHINVGASLGYAIYGRQGTSRSELLQAADMALYCQKRGGGRRRKTALKAERRAAA